MVLPPLLCWCPRCLSALGSRAAPWLFEQTPRTLAAGRPRPGGTLSALAEC